jgi:hypothetical protein
LIAETAHCVVDAAIVIGQFLGVEDMISIYAVREVIT